MVEALEVGVCTLNHFHEEGLGDGDEASAEEGELARVRERERYLRELNEKFYEQLRDKGEVIGLLRKQDG